MTIRSYFFMNDSEEVQEVLEQEREFFSNKDFKRIIHRITKDIVYDEEIKHIMCVTTKDIFHDEEIKHIMCVTTIDDSNILFLIHADISFTPQGKEGLWIITLERPQDGKKQRLRVV